MAGFGLGRLPANDEELYHTVRAMWGLTIPRTKVCPDHVAPFTAFADAYWGRNSINPESEQDSIALWHGSRGLSGKSVALSILGLTKAVLRGTHVTLLGGSLAQSTNIAMHMTNALDYRNAPAQMVADYTATRRVLTNKAEIHPLTASQRAVRGPHRPFLLCDEIDEMELAILDAALGQPMPQYNYLHQLNDPYTVMCSTWQRPNGTFTEVMRRAIETDIPIYKWCFEESANPIDGWLSRKTIDEKRRQISKAAWESEYLLNEPSIGSRAFDTEAVDRAFSLDFTPLTEKESKDFAEYTFEKPSREGVYVGGADWGRDHDYTVIAIGRIDVKPHRLVYYLRVNRRPYPQMIGWFNKALERYKAQAAHDATGLGNVVDDYVDGRRARKFIMTGEKRAAMLSTYVSAIENDKWRFPKIKTAYIETKFAEVGDLYSSTKDYHLPDTVCAFALMHHMVARHAPVARPMTVPRDQSASKRVAMFEPPKEGGARSLDSPDAPLVGAISLTV